jgi:hypothetical protein
VRSPRLSGAMALITQPDRSNRDALGRRRRHGRLTLRTVSVRQGDDDVRRLVQLKVARELAEAGSDNEHELSAVRGRHVAYNAPTRGRTGAPLGAQVCA